MSILSAIRVSESTSARLVIIDPPFYLFGGIFLIVAAFIFRLAFPVRGESKPTGGFNSLAVFIAAPFALIGMLMMTSRTEIVFSRPDQKMMLRGRYLGLPLRNIDLALADIRYATVESTRGSRRLLLVLNSGATISLGVATQRPGHHGAATAINDFLAARLVH